MFHVVRMGTLYYGSITDESLYYVVVRNLNTQMAVPSITYISNSYAQHYIYIKQLCFTAYLHYTQQWQPTVYLHHHPIVVAPYNTPTLNSTLQYVYIQQQYPTVHLNSIVVPRGTSTFNSSALGYIYIPQQCSTVHLHSIVVPYSTSIFNSSILQYICCQQ